MVIYPKDLLFISALRIYSHRSARRRYAMIRDVLGKPAHALLTTAELAGYYCIPESEVIPEGPRRPSAAQ